VVVQFDCHPEQAWFAKRGIWASRAKGRVLCDPTIARLARFLTKLHHYPSSYLFEPWPRATIQCPHLTASLFSESPLLKDLSARRESQRRLLRWYDRCKRDLPWRQDRDPYRVWVSEIMLQQTRVAAVIDHYQRFLRRFPTMRRLAAAREAQVLAVWSGLGYYRRARMMHTTAKKIVKEHKGQFPASAENLRGLPGIGPYTSAAIASIAFDEPVAVVDGNVERVLSRLLGRQLAGEQAWAAAEGLLTRQRPGDFNQAMMELGATVCLPKSPACLMCPVSGLCATRGELPGSKKATRQRKVVIHYGLNCRNGSVLLVQRSRDASLMPGMWELPELPASAASKTLLVLRHSITVTDYDVRVQQGQGRTPYGVGGELSLGTWVARSKLAKLPLTGLAKKILRAAKII
jgi:A/G-specific adenine glycosylase